MDPLISFSVPQGDQKNPHLPSEDRSTPSSEHASQSEEYDPSLYSEDLVYGSNKKLANVYRGRVVTKQELADHG
jgi:hypothetical protein